MSKKSMWDKRYSAKEYVYGEQPNDFLKMNVHCLPKGKILSLAEGEGRNAVYLATLGYSVTAVDSSFVGLEKAKKFADKHEVEIDFILADLAKYEISESHWDGIISIFCPLPSMMRKALHQKIELGLKQNGIFLLEAYTPNQINHGTGGGNSTDTMQTSETLRNELKGVSFSHLKELEREVIEGIYHTGMGSVVQAIANKTT